VIFILPVVGIVATSAVVWVLLKRGNLTTLQQVSSALICAVLGALGSGAAWVAIGQAGADHPWPARRVSNAFWGMSLAVFAAVCARFVPAVVARFRNNVLSRAVAIVLSAVLLLVGFLSWFGAVSW
jgi:hypothetical protein